MATFSFEPSNRALQRTGGLALLVSRPLTAAFATLGMAAFEEVDEARTVGLTR